MHVTAERRLRARRGKAGRRILCAGDVVPAGGVVRTCVHE